MTTNPEAVPAGYTPEEIKRKEKRNTWMAVSFFIIVLFGALSFTPGREDLPLFNLNFFLLGVLFGVIVYVAAFMAPEAARRRERARQRSEAILDSINANLARLCQLEESLTQFDSRLRRLEKSNTPPPRPP